MLLPNTGSEEAAAIRLRLDRLRLVVLRLAREILIRVVAAAQVAAAEMLETATQPELAVRMAATETELLVEPDRAPRPGSLQRLPENFTPVAAVVAKTTHHRMRAAKVVAALAATPW